jgi:hypothetical protein
METQNRMTCGPHEREEVVPNNLAKGVQTIDHPNDADGIDAAPPLDFTKKRWYAILDLAVKYLSALGILFLGFVGYCFQRDTEASKERITSQDRSERKYLPELRSISEVSIVLLEASTQFDTDTYTREEAEREARVGAHLAYAGGTLYFPDGQPNVHIKSARDILAKDVSARAVTTTARSAVLFLADFMRYAPVFQKWDRNAEVIVVAKGEQLQIVDTRTKQIKYLDVLDPRASDTWNAWLPAGGLTPSDLFRGIDLTVITDDIDEQLVAISDETVRKHPELADQYVSIRSDVLKARPDLLPRQ